MLNRRFFWIVFAVMAMLTAVVQFVPADGPGEPAAGSEGESPEEPPASNDAR